MNKKNYDSDFCGSLPLNFINQVQPYGFLVVTDPHLKVVQVSDNIKDHTGREVHETLNLPLKNLVDDKNISHLTDKIESQGHYRFSCRLDVKKGAATSPFLAVVHNKTDYFLFEFEALNENQNKSFQEVYQQIREASYSIQQSRDLREGLDIATRELKRVSGFDKVMIYQFDEDWNGHVVSEQMEKGMDSYLGLNFPASDIPRQARELYLKNPFRQIPDKDYVPAKMAPVINPLLAGFTDMSDCNMRAVAKVHIEYLGNMKVVASMSTRIIKDNQLWGLISCHHRSPKFLSYDECSVFEMLSTIISSKISSMEVQERYNQAKDLQKTESLVVKDLYSEKTLEKGLMKTGQNLMQVLKCGGLAYVTDEKTMGLGKYPDKTHLDDLVLWLQTLSLSSFFHTSHLREHYDEADAITKEASGILAFPINTKNNEWIIGFRPEVKRQISWGGNPGEAIRFEEDQSTYHPRNSFNMYQEELRENSIPFSTQELAFAKDLHHLLIDFAYKQQSRQ